MAVSRNPPGISYWLPTDNPGIIKHVLSIVGSPTIVIRIPRQQNLSIKSKSKLKPPGPFQVLVASIYQGNPCWPIFDPHPTGCLNDSSIRLILIRGSCHLCHVQGHAPSYGAAQLASVQVLAAEGFGFGGIRRDGGSRKVLDQITCCVVTVHVLSSVYTDMGCLNRNKLTIEFLELV